MMIDKNEKLDEEVEEEEEGRRWRRRSN